MAWFNLHAIKPVDLLANGTDKLEVGNVDLARENFFVKEEMVGQ